MARTRGRQIGGDVAGYAEVHAAGAVMTPSCLPIALLAAFSARDAHATSCGGPPEAFGTLPVSEGGPRPTNTVIRIERAELGTVVVLEDGIERLDVLEEIQPGAVFGALVLSTSVPFESGATVEAWRIDEVGVEFREPLVTFVVGDEPDFEPPVWDGSYTVDNARELGFHPCLPLPTTFRTHGFRWIGLSDETWATEELLVIAVPRLESGEPVLGAGEHASVSFGGVCGPDEDASLRGDFHRVYDVFVEDGSGNRIGPFEVDTREHVSGGCSALAAARVGPTLLLIGIALVRRRHREGTPSRRSPMPATAFSSRRASRALRSWLRRRG
jgi:hypothetical protein